MAEEAKKDAQGEGCCSGAAKTILKIIVGAAIILVGIALVWAFRWELAIVFKGCIGLLLILVGAITVAIARD